MGVNDLPTFGEYQHEVKQKADEPSRFDRAHARKVERQSDWRRVCKAVDARDHRICRACGRKSDPDAVGLLARGHRHHIVYRSAGGKDDTGNILTLCAGCHSDEHRHALRIDGNADLALTFERKDANGIWYVSRQELAPHIAERD